MKQVIIYLALSALIAGGVSSCENEIPYTPPGMKEPQLIMNALLDAAKRKTSCT